MGNFRWTFVLPALVATMVGMELGGALSRRIPSIWLQRGLGILMSVVAVAIAIHQAMR